MSIRRLSVVVLLALSACGVAQHRPPPPNHARPAAFAPPSRAALNQCYGDLARIGVSYRALPDRDRGGGCSTIGTVQLIDIGVPVANLGPMRCGLAETFSQWVRNAVAPAAHQILGSDLVKVETFGTYACRATVGTANAHLSGHAIANAVDVSAFDLADGRRISVLGDWRSGDPQVRAFWGAIHRSACRRFGTVLDPDYNAAHQNHLHLEDDHANFCR